MTIQELLAVKARARRDEIIRQVGGDEARFRERARNHLLDVEELALYDELRALDYLLG